MTEQEYNSFVNFIDKLLYEIMTLEDYEIILNRLNIPIRVKTSERWGCATGCHNVNAYEGGSNLSFYTEDKSFHCFSQCACNYNLITLVEQRFKLLGEPKKRIQCTKWICEQLGIPFEFNVEIKHENTTIYNWKANLDKYIVKDEPKEELVCYDQDEDKLMQITDDLYIQEWLEDGISMDAQDYYGIRYYKRLNQAVIFVKDVLGRLVGVRVRNFNPDFKAKYDVFRALDNTVNGKYNDKGYVCPTSMILFGEYQNAFNCKRKKQAWLPESEKGVEQCHDIVGKDENCALGMMGSNLGDENIKKLVSWGVEVVIIFADSDFKVYPNEVGEYEIDYDDPEYIHWLKKMVKLYRKLKPYFTVYIVYNNIGLTDFYKCAPTDRGADVFWKLWEHKELIDLTEEEIREILERD